MPDTSAIPSRPAKLPAFDVRLTPPDVSPWRDGNAGLPGFMTFAAARPGPHLVVTALIHGNEIAGAIVIDELLRANVRPARGRLTLGLCNLAAFDRFDARQPTASRFVDEDLNRLWDVALLSGPRHSLELDRARAMLPIIGGADALLDLHSMLWPSDPLILCGGTARGRDLAVAIGAPPLVVADRGHATGRRLIDHERFTAEDSDAVAVLVEAGQHWQAPTVSMMHASVHGLLRRLGMTDSVARPVLGTPRFAEVTEAITAQTGQFTFVRPFRGGDIVAERGTVIAHDGNTEIRTPHDDCLLIMPSLKPSRGHTAVRLARYADGGGAHIPSARR